MPTTICIYLLVPGLLFFLPPLSLSLSPSLLRILPSLSEGKGKDQEVQAEEVAVEGDQVDGDARVAHPCDVGESIREEPAAGEDELDGQVHVQGNSRDSSGGGGDDDGAMNSSGCGGEADGDAAGDADGVEGSKRATVRLKDDSDFDDLLASYLEGLDAEDDGSGNGSGSGGDGIFGKSGGSLLMPLGALRLLRYAGVVCRVETNGRRTTRKRACTGWSRIDSYGIKHGASLPSPSLPSHPLPSPPLPTARICSRLPNLHFSSTRDTCPILMYNTLSNFRCSFCRCLVRFASRVRPILLDICHPCPAGVGWSWSATRVTFRTRR